MLKPVIFYVRTQLRRCRCFLCTLCLSAALFFAPNFSFAITPDYIPLEYIEVATEDNKSARINTRIVPRNASISIDFDVQLREYVDDTGMIRIYSGDAAHPGEAVGFGTHNDHWAMILPGTNWGEFATVSYNRLQATWTIDGGTGTSTLSGGLSNTSTSLAHLGNDLLWRNYAITFGRMRYYSVKIRLDNTLVFNGIPAKRKLDGAVGMYDLVSGDFFKSENSEEFIAGPELYTFLDYIESTGNQYINTGVKLADNDKTYYDVDFEITRNTNHCSLWGAYSSSSNTRSGYLYVGSSYLQFAVGASNDAMLTGYPTSSLAGVRHHWLLYVDDNTKERTIKDIQNGSIISTSTFSGTLLKNVNLCLFGFPAGERSYLKLYSFKMTINGMVVRNFIPAKNSNNVVGMYDTVTNTFFTNSGTGTFTAGPVSIACGVSLNILGDEMCVETTVPVWPYLTAWNNGHKYYIPLSENDYPIHSGSSNKIKIKINDDLIYSAYDGSVE